MVTRNNESTRTGQENTISSVYNTFKIIYKLQELGGNAKLSEISRNINISKSSVHKHLNTLHELGYINKKGSQYSLSMKFLDLGGFVRDQFTENKAIKAKVVELASKTGELAFFNIEEHGKQIVLFREAGVDGVETRTRVGTRLYLHQGAAGKAILSQYSDQRIQEILNKQGLPAVTDNTITEFEEFMEEIEQVRARGYATSEEEATEGLLSVAVPLTNNQGYPLGGFAVAGPVHRMSDRVHGEIPKVLHSVVNEMELNIRYSKS